MPTQEDHRIFISYAHRDGARLAARLQQDLTASGFDAWLDSQRLKAGAVWTAEIEREIDARQVTLALLTPGSYESEICRAEQLRALRTLKDHSADVNGVAVSPDGQRAVSASEDKTFKLWDLETGAVLATFTCDAAAFSCAFINDRKLIAGDALGRVHFLCLEEAERKK